jgi:hypothetical protein
VPSEIIIEVERIEIREVERVVEKPVEVIV